MRGGNKVECVCVCVCLGACVYANGEDRIHAGFMPGAEAAVTEFPIPNSFL